MFWILAGAVAAGTLLYFLLKGRRKKKLQMPMPAPSPGWSPMPIPSPEPGRESPERDPPHARKRTNAEIERIADRTEFSAGPLSVREMVPSQAPTAHVSVRPIQSVTELPRMLASQHGLDDDLFYGRLATGQIPVIAYSTPSPESGIVVLLQDVSGSMKEHGRAGWAVGLNQRIISRAEDRSAQVALLTFRDKPGKWRTAESTEERSTLSAQLPQLFAPDGGTDVISPLKAAIDLLSQEEFTIRRIVLVTDGQAELNVREMRSALAAINAELHVVCIGPHNPDLEAIATHYDLLVD